MFDRSDEASILQVIENPQEMTTIIREPNVSSPIENWAVKEQRMGNPMAGVFTFKDKVNIIDAWKKVGGDRYGVTTRPAVAMMQDNSQMEIKDRRWLFPTWDNSEYYIKDKDGELRKSVQMVSDHFEVIQPQDAIQVLYENMVDSKGNPLPVTAIAASNDLSEVIVQWQTGSTEVGGDLLNRYVAARVCMIGSIVGAFFDVRFNCTNKLPLLLSNAQFAISHRTGANQRLQDKFSGMMNMFQIAQGLHGHSYNLLAEIPMNEEDQKYIAEQMYPYQLPDGYSQRTNAATVHELVLQGKAPKKNLKLVEYRSLARYGIRQAIEENGKSTLWEGAQANFSANHRMTRSYAAQATQLAFEGGERRDEAVRGFKAALLLAASKGYQNQLPPQMLRAAKQTLMLDDFSDFVEDSILSDIQQLELPF